MVLGYLGKLQWWWSAFQATGGGVNVRVILSRQLDYQCLQGDIQFIDDFGLQVLLIETLLLVALPFGFNQGPQFVTSHYTVRTWKLKEEVSPILSKAKILYGYLNGDAGYFKEL